MLPADALRKLLETKVIAACAAIDLPVRLDKNAPFNQPRDGRLWADFEFVLGKTRTMEAGSHGRGFKRQAGLLQFTIYAAENTGNGPALRAGDTLAQSFDRVQLQVEDGGYLCIDDMSVHTDGAVRDGFECIIADATFDFTFKRAD